MVSITKHSNLGRCVHLEAKCCYTRCIRNSPACTRANDYISLRILCKFSMNFTGIVGYTLVKFENTGALIGNRRCLFPETQHLKYQKTYTCLVNIAT